MLGFPYLLGGLSVAALASFLLGVHVGNTYGGNARAYARVVAEIARKNAELDRLKAEDAAIEAREKAAEERKAADFSKSAPKLKPCLLGRAEVEALNKVSGD